MNTEKISISIEKNPCIAAAVARFDLLKGVKVDYRWFFSDEEMKIKFEDIFKTALGNVHRQEEKYFLECSISTTDIHQFDWILVTSIFCLPKKPDSVYYSLGFVFTRSMMKNNIYFQNFMNLKIKILSDLLKACITENKSLSTLTSPIIAFVTNISQISLCGISDIPKCDFSDIDSSFLALALTSHLQTQMTTIIECKTSHDSKNISSFLANFLLPAQLEMSSMIVHPIPIPGLFLQCVERQKVAKHELMIKFQRPVTWIKLSDFSIEQTDIESCDFQNISSLSYKYYYYFHLGAKAKVNQLLQQYRIEQVKVPSPWACLTTQSIIQSPKFTQEIICEIQMGAIIRTAIAYISLLLEKEKQYPVENHLLSNYSYESVSKTLKLVRNDDLKIVKSISNLFHPKFPKNYIHNPRTIQPSLMM